MCHFSLVTQPPEKLAFLQRVPHIDSVRGDGLATVHYLFHGDWGGTAFYRHRQSGFECIDANRAREPTSDRLEQESRRATLPAPAISMTTPRCSSASPMWMASFNRMIVYRRNSLHSGRIDNARMPPADPLAGRLSINTFIDVLH